jgi:hypothetical protein
MLSVWKSIAPLLRCRIIACGILLSGFCCAAAIYLTAPEVPDNPFAEYENSKRFAHEVERMGGKAAIVANDISTWLTGLWQGQQLSYTIAVITVIIAVGYYFVATGLIGQALLRHDESQPPFSEE